MQLTIEAQVIHSFLYNHYTLKKKKYGNPYWCIDQNCLNETCFPSWVS